MLEEKITNYFDSVEPPEELTERMIEMLKENKNKKIKLSKGIIAAIIAAVVLCVGITGYAAVTRIFGDEKGIVNDEQTNGFVFDFSKASRIPLLDGEDNSPLEKEIISMKLADNIQLPAPLTDSSVEITHKLYPFINEKSCMLDLKSDSYESLSLQLYTGLSDDEMNGYIGTGDDNTICNVKNVNGIDICICIEGDAEIGYSPYFFYAVDDTLYCINFFSGASYENAVTQADNFISELK